MNKRWLDATWQMDRAVKAEAERDSLRALLREAREYCYPVNPSPADTSNMRFRIDALLAKDKS